MSGKSLILIVDDIESGRETMAAILTTPEYELAFACNGEEALSKSEALAPDLLLLDVMMPDMSGFEVCRRLRKHHKLAEVPIILVTALDDRQSLLEGLDAGADDFVTKPFDRAELRVRVRTVTRLNRYRRLLSERERFEWVVEQAGDGYLVLDPQGQIIYANRSAIRLLELTPPQPNSPQNFVAQVQKRFRTEPAQIWQSWAQQTDSTLRQRLYLIRPETSTSPAVWLEVTVLKQAHGTRLEQLVHVRDVTVERGTQRDTWTFHAMIMHKLNTPLQTVLGSLEMLSPENVVSLGKEDIGTLAHFAHTGVLRLSDTIRDILQYLGAPIMAQMGEGFDVSRIPALVDQISLDLGIQTEVVMKTALPGRQLRLSQRAIECVLWELLENARKFHPRQMPLVIVRITYESPQTLHLQIIDNGITLSPDQLLRVWSPYYQGEKYFTGERPGTGLGLSMVAALVWEVGGECIFRNRDDSPGVIVELALPLIR